MSHHTPECKEAPKEISAKLAHELMDRLMRLQRRCDAMAKKYHDTDAICASVLCHDAITHLDWHLRAHAEAQAPRSSEPTAQAGPAAYW